MRATEQRDLHSFVRELQCGAPFFLIELNEQISIYFDFNFADGQKELFFGLLFSYYSGNSLRDSIKDVLQNFFSNTLGGSSDMPNHGGFSFSDFAGELATDLIESLVVDVNVELDFAFGLDLNPTFDKNARSRYPDLFIRINHFDTWGAVGVLDWTSNLVLPLGLDLFVSEARAMLNISSTLSTYPIRMASPSQLATLVNPLNEDSERIIFNADLDVVLPIFLTYEGIGLGTRIEYL